MQPTTQRSNYQISDYRGQEVIRTALTTREYLQRISLVAALILFTFGFAFCYRPAQKLWNEVKEGNKITYLTQEDMEEHIEIAKTNQVGTKLLKGKNSEKEQLSTNLSTTKAGDHLAPPIQNKTKEIISLKVNQQSEKEPAQKLAQNHSTQSDSKAAVNQTHDIKPLPNTNKKNETTSIPQAQGNSLAESIIRSKLLEKFDQIKPHFANIKSNQLVDSNGLKTRKDFMDAAEEGRLVPDPVIIARSPIIPGRVSDMISHLMCLKEDLKFNKYVPGDSITNMEGALHTFITPITPITITGDYVYRNGHTINEFQGKARKVILSAAIHPDFEQEGDNEVVMKIVEAKDAAVEGEKLPEYFLPLSAQMLLEPLPWNNHDKILAIVAQRLAEHEKRLQKHMVYHLTEGHRLPSLNEILPACIIEPEKAISLIEEMVKKEEIIDPSTNLYFVKLNGHVISLEALLNIYLHQIRNEFTALEALLPQGYVYTIDPPSTFATQIGIRNVSLLNRLQLLAIKMLNQHLPLNNLKIIGISDLADPGIVNLYKQAFPKKSDKIYSKDQLLSNNGFYSVEEAYALVVHNNSNGFGQNIETEECTSLNGVISNYSNAAVNLKRTRHDSHEHINQDLLNYVVEVI